MFMSTEIDNEKYEFIKGYNEEMMQWLQDIDDKTSLLFNQTPLHPSDLGHFDRSLLFGFTNRELVLKVLRLVTDIDDIHKSYIVEIRNPKEYAFGTSDFEMDIRTSYILKAPMRYISNVDAYKLTKDANEILKEVKKSDYDLRNHDNYDKKRFYRGRVLAREDYLVLLREATLMRNFTQKYASSRRLLPIYKLIQIVIETSNFSRTRGFPWKQNPILSTLKQLYHGHDDFPYREVETDTIFTSKASMILPEITFALVELWFKYLMIDMTPEELIVGINSQLEWATTSLDEKLLNFKDSRVNFNKILVEHAISIIGITHGFRSLSGIIVDDKPSEIWMDEIREKSPEYIDYQQEFITNAPKALLHYLAKIKILNDDFTFSKSRTLKTLSDVRRLYIVVNVIAQHGLFIKNPVVLTIEKSILPRASIAYTPEALTHIYNPNIFTAKLPFKMNWNESPIFRKMYYQGKHLIAKYRERYDKLNLEDEFIKSLTNNSGGVDYQPTEHESVTIPASILRVFGKKRLMYFLLNPILYESYGEWIGALKSMTNSGERKQVDRRGRVIQMVSNAAQLAPFLLFLWADLMGKEEPELSSKKNTGTIVDINVLLRSTADIYSVQESADISGMDASTTRLSTSLINGMLIELLQNCNHQQYFFAKRNRWDIIKMENNSEKVVESVMVHPGVQITQMSEAISESYNYKLHIPELSNFGIKAIMDTSPHVFPSGKFSTNAQHSILNTLVLRVFREILGASCLEMKIPMFDMEGKVSGDDIYLAFKLRTNSDIACRKFSSELVKIFTQIGFKIGSLLSRYNATFLQQSAIFGTVLPKPDRISLTTSERGDSLKLSVFDAFSELRDITKELSGRVHFPSNTRGFLFAVANQLRRIRVNTTALGNETIQKLKTIRTSFHHLDSTFCTQAGFVETAIPYRLLIGKSYCHIILPLISLFTFGGFDLPFPSFVTNKYVSGSNSFTPRGTISDWKIRQLLVKSNRTLTDYSLSDDLLLAISNQSLSNGDFNLLRKKVRALDETIRQDISKYLANLYDDTLATFLGLSWLKHFKKFNVKDVLDRIRLANFPKEAREEWANRLKFRLNFDALVKSKLAGMKLTDAGFKTSNRLAFYNSPNERITQAITSGGDNAQEFRVHRMELILHMSEYTEKFDWMESIDYETVMLCNYTSGSDHVQITRDFIIDVYGKLMLSSSIDLDRDFILYKFGHNFYDLSVQFSGYYALTPGPFKDYKHEELVKFASKVKHERPDMLNLVWEFANVHERYRRELEHIIDFGEAGEINEWRSIIHKRQTFELSSAIRHVNRLWEPIYDLHDRRLERMVLSILRDIAYSENNILLTKARFKYSQAFLLIHGGVRSKLRSLISISTTSSRA